MEESELEPSLLPPSVTAIHPQPQIRGWRAEFLMGLSQGVELAGDALQCCPTPRPRAARDPGQREGRGRGGAMHPEASLWATPVFSATPCGAVVVWTAPLCLGLFPAGSEARERPGPGCARPVCLWGGCLRLSARRQPPRGELTAGPGRLWPGMRPEHRGVLQTR